MTHRHTRVLIVGSGPAGYTAGIYAARANLHPVIIAGMQPGGQLTITDEVENFPGAHPIVTGPQLVQNMADQAQQCGATIEYDLVTEVDFSTRPYVCRTDSGQVYTADSIIISTGARAKWLGLDSEKRYQGRGVSGCATCDGFFYRKKDVVVVGGGNTAVEEALYLAGLCNTVTVVHRGAALRAEPVLCDRLSARDNIKVIYNTVVDEILGEEAPMGGVTGISLRAKDSKETTVVPCEGVFIAIGHAPETSLFAGKIDLEPSGHIRIGNWSTEVFQDGACLPGVYAAGDVADARYRQAVTAAGMGCMAALSAQKYLETVSH